MDGQNRKKAHCTNSMRNEGDFLRNVHNQSQTNDNSLEWIIIDDSSNDSSEIIEFSRMFLD